MTTESSDALKIVRDRAQSNSFWRNLNIEVEDAKEGWCRLKLPIHEGLRNSATGPIHGGVYSALVDMAVGGALSTMLGGAAAGVGMSTLDLNVSFIAAASGDTIVAEGRVIRRGRSVAFGETNVMDADGKLVAVGRATFMILQPTA